MIDNNKLIEAYLSIIGDDIITEADTSSKSNKSPVLNKKISFDIKYYNLNGIKDIKIKNEVKDICHSIGGNLKNDLNSLGTFGALINDKTNKFKESIDELNESLKKLNYFEDFENNEQEKSKKINEDEEKKSTAEGSITVNGKDGGKYKVSNDSTDLTISV